MDGFGLWTINRDGDPKARSTSQIYATDYSYNIAFDTLGGLADQVGMDVNEILAWITAEGKYRIVGKSGLKRIDEIGVDDRWCPGQTVKVPNTIFSAFFDIDVPGSADKFEDDYKFLKSKGLMVKLYYNHQHFPTTDRKEAFLRMIKQYSNDRILWGLHLSAHGGPNQDVADPPPINSQTAIFGASPSQGPPTILYNDLELMYKLGVFFGFTCYSSYGAPVVLFGQGKHKWTTPLKLAPGLGLDPNPPGLPIPGYHPWEAPYIYKVW